MRWNSCDVLWLSLLLSAGVNPASAEPTGSIGGSVRGPDGSRLPGVVLSLALADGSQRLRIVTTAAGLYFVSELGPGTYTLDGGTRWLRDPHRVRHGRGRPAHTARSVLALAMVEEHVEVVGAGPREASNWAGFARSPHETWPTPPTAARHRPDCARRGIAGDIVFRGLQSRDLTVVIDGQRVQGACPNHMDPPSFHVDLAEVQRVEVAKGPFDVRHQGSLGGVVNVVTQRPAAAAGMA